jgi:hypothetical protein
MADKAPVEVVVHEAANWLEESDPKIHAKVQKFFESRTAGEKWQKLSELMGNRNYSETEVAKPDKWLRTYMGKKTNSTNSEILSMGMEVIYKAPVDFAKADPRILCFHIQYIKGEIADSPKSFCQQILFSRNQLPDPNPSRRPSHYAVIMTRDGFSVFGRKVFHLSNAFPVWRVADRATFKRDRQSIGINPLGYSRRIDLLKPQRRSGDNQIFKNYRTTRVGLDRGNSRLVRIQ